MLVLLPVVKAYFKVTCSDFAALAYQIHMLNAFIGSNIILKDTGATVFRASGTMEVLDERLKLNCAVWFGPSFVHFPTEMYSSCL